MTRRGYEISICLDSTEGMQTQVFDDELSLAMINAIEALSLEVPTTADVLVPDALTEREIEHVVRQLQKHQNCEDEDDLRTINALFSVNPLTNEKIEDPLVEEFRKKIHDDYDDKLLGTEVIPDSPKRGPYGEAYIALLENYVPTRSKLFRMHGEKCEAHVKVTQEWLDQKFLEKPPEAQVVEWLSLVFVVPKKSADFLWRG